MLSVRDLLRDLQLTAMAGEPNLDAPVRWVHATELADPTPWLSGGELLLTTGMALDDEESQRAYVRRLADHGVSGLGFGTGLHHAAVPAPLFAAALEHDLPLFEVPYDVPFIALTEKAFTRLVNEQYVLLQRSIAAQERLHRIVLSEGGLEAIAAAIAQTVGATALVYDGRGELLAQHAFRVRLTEAVVAGVGEELHDRARRGDGRGFVPTHGGIAPQALALPVASAGSAPGDGVPQAWLVAIKDAGPPTEFDRLVLHQAVTAVALEQLSRRVADATERRLAGNVLNAVVRGELAGPDLARRLEPFGLGGRVTALVMQATGTRAQAAACEAALASALQDEAISGLVASTGPLACALMPGFLDDELFDLAERIHERVSATLGTAPAAGVGRAVVLDRARESFHEARCALEARMLAGDGEGPRSRRPVASYHDLGSFQLLLALQDTDALRLYCDSLLGPIEQGEGHYGGELMRSLEAFIEANGQWEAAARQLYCHRHTLRYRIRKVEELTGRDLSTARDRIEFWLALRGRELAPRGASHVVTPASTTTSRDEVA